MKRIILYIALVVGFWNASSAQSLDDYFKTAAENNPGLQAKYKAFEASLQRTAQVGSLPDPTLSFAYFISPVETRVGPQRMTFSLSQMFPWFGTLKAKEQAATFMAEAKYAEFLDARNKLYYHVAAAYYPLFELEQKILLEKENLNILKSYKDIATTKYQNGKGEMVDVLRVDIMLNEAQTNLNLLEQMRLPLQSQFNQLLNRPDTAGVQVTDSLVLQEIPMNYRRDSLIQANPLLAELELKVKASVASEEAAIKQGMPKLGVGLNYIVVGPRKDVAVSGNGKDAVLPMVSMSLPVFRKKYRAARKEAQLMQESYALQKQEVANRLNYSYEKVWYELIRQKELANLYTKQIEESKQTLHLLFVAYGNSGKDFIEALRMQQQVLNYQKLQASALASYYVALAELDYITAKNG
ncbi:MAG: TolC family protein [Bacteroidetes bacterium]|nr:TolC family protein [Bacteroidota bacterium]